MMEFEKLTIPARGFTFDSYRASGSKAPVILVHGWPEFASCWEPVAAQLAAAGHQVLAYDQRGYSPGARPEDVAAYAVEELVADLGAIADAVGFDRFHLVGHDWGGVMGWAAAVEYADRILTFTAVSTAHTAAHGEAIKTDPEQYERMDYLRKIRDHPNEVAVSMLRNDGEKLRAVYGGAVPAGRVDEYVSRFSAPGVMDAALKFYRALGLGRQMPVKPITVPVTYIWGSEDAAFGRRAAENTGKYVDGPYRFEELTGASHWLPEEKPEELARIILEAISGAD